MQIVLPFSNVQSQMGLLTVESLTVASVTAKTRFTLLWPLAYNLPSVRLRPPHSQKIFRYFGSEQKTAFTTPSVPVTKSWIRDALVSSTWGRPVTSRVRAGLWTRRSLPWSKVEYWTLYTKACKSKTKLLRNYFENVLKLAITGLLLIYFQSLETTV